MERNYVYASLGPKGTVGDVVEVKPGGEEFYAGWDDPHRLVPEGTYKCVATGCPHFCAKWERIEKADCCRCGAPAVEDNFCGEHIPVICPKCGDEAFTDNLRAPFCSTCQEFLTD